METDYQRALALVAELPKFHLGQEVQTENGTGILIKLEMPQNGLYVSPERSRAVVWHSTQKAVEEGLRWIVAEYRLDEIKPI